MSPARKYVLFLTSALFLAAVPVFAWIGPTSVPPNGNVAAPINVGAAEQLKEGAIGVGGLAVFGNSLLQTSSYLNWGTISGQSGYGIRDNRGTLEFKNNAGLWATLDAIITKYLYLNSVGIKTASPYEPASLTVDMAPSLSAFPMLIIQRSTAANSSGYGILFNYYKNDGSTFPKSMNIGMDYNGALRIDRTNDDSVADIVLDQNGRVGIGTAYPAAKLNVTGGSIYIDGDYAGGNLIAFRNTDTSYYSGGHQWEIYPSGGSSGSLSFYDRTAARTTLNLSNSGTATFAGNVYGASFSQTSDARLKQAIQPLRDGLDTIERLDPVSFTWRSGPSQGHADTGLIAQEVQEIAPELVATTSPSELTPDGTLTINYIGLIPYIIESIQELASKLSGTAHLAIDAVTARVGEFSRVNAEDVCLKKSDGTQVCITGDELAALLAR